MLLEILVQMEYREYPYSIMRYQKNDREQKVVLSVLGAPEKRIVITEKEPMKVVCTFRCDATVKYGSDDRPTPLVITIPRPVNQC